MKIGLNATCISDRPSGAKQRFVGIYLNLIKQLQEVEFVIYEPVDSQPGKLFKNFKNIKIQQTAIHSEEYLKKFASSIGYWNTLLKNDNLDIFEIFNLPLYKNPKGQTFLTIHDLRGLHLKWNPIKKIIYKEALKRSVNSSDHIITVSNYMKKELTKLYPQKKISVVYNGISPLEFDKISENDLNFFKHKYNIPSNFILTVGHFEKRKNYLKLIEAIDFLNQKKQSYPLIIIGNDSGYKKQIENKINNLNLNKNITILSNLNDFEVRCAYKSCSLFVFPSIYEGFGIPILEAMAAKCPIALSDIEVFREITENKSIYFSHDNIESIASSIEKIILSKEKQNNQINYGINRIKFFEFQNLSKIVQNIYMDTL